MSHIHTQRRSTHSFLSTVGHIGRKGRKENQIRKKIIDDLIVFINKLQANNHEAILTVDVNETFESRKGGVTKLSSITNLVDPIVWCTQKLFYIHFPKDTPIYMFIWYHPIQ